MRDIKVLGAGCPKCNQLESLVKKTADELNGDYTYEKVSDITEILEYGVMTTPALVVDGVVKATGRIPAIDELKELILK